MRGGRSYRTLRWPGSANLEVSHPRTLSTALSGCKLPFCSRPPLTSIDVCLVVPRAGRGLAVLRRRRHSPRRWSDSTSWRSLLGTPGLPRTFSSKKTSVAVPYARLV